jgi:thioredoxin 2
VLVDFWTAWCEPCKMVAPELEKVAGMAVGKALVAKLNTEEVPEIAAQYRISSIPTMVLVQNGRELARLSGARPAADIFAFIRSQTSGGR